MRSGQPRLIGYLAVAAGLGVLRFGLNDSTWRGSAEFHTVIEVLSALIAVIVGAVAILRFYTRKTMRFLLAGVAFSGTAVLDAVHATVTSSFLLGWSTSDASGLVPWSWFAARLFLASLLAARTWRRGTSGDAPVRERGILLTTGAILLITIAGMALVALPRAQFPELSAHRPQEFVPAALLVYALAGHLRMGDWKTDPFEHSLILSIILGLGTQALFMPFSATPYDAMFDAAHALKFVSNGVVLVGLLAASFRLFRQAELDFEQSTFGFLENLPVGVFILEATGKPYYANGRGSQILGRGADPNVRTRDLAKVFKAYLAGSDEEYPADRFPLVRALSGERSVTSDMEIRHEGGTIPIQMSGAPILDNQGKVKYAIAAFQDIRDLRRAALEDPLTGLANRLAFQEAYGRIAGLCWRTDQPLCVAVIDLDHFKRINDTYGHDAGDEALRRSASLISGNMRATDLVARWGGEEITVLFPGATLAGAVDSIERALTSLRAEKFDALGKTFSVTFSAGVVEVENGSPLSQAVSNADRYLYQAKESGRNRVCSSALSS